jgi:hypothetical protein
MHRYITAPEIVTQAQAHAHALVQDANKGRKITERQYADAYTRVFPMLLTKLMDNVERLYGARRATELRSTVTEYLESIS